jgi:hypothetical protein
MHSNHLPTTNSIQEQPAANANHQPTAKYTVISSQQQIASQKNHSQRIPSANNNQQLTETRSQQQNTQESAANNK